MKHKMTTILIRCSAVILTVTQGCGSKATTPAPAATPGPSGRAFSGDINYFDAAPSLSSDGLKLVFESGRSKSILRIFKVNVPTDPTQSDAATDTPTRLTGTDDLNSETSPLVFPDGVNVAFIGATSTGSRGVYVAPWVGGTTTKFSADGEQVYSHGISPDSALLAYIAIDSTTGSSSVIVVDAANSATRATLTTGTRKITSLRWLRSNGGNYKLATVSLSESSGTSLTRIEIWPFANTAAVAAASPTTLTDKSVTAISDHAARWLVQDGTKILTVQPLAPASARSVSEVGAGALADRQIYARNDLLLLDPNTGAESHIDSAVASVITGLSASTSAALLVTNETARCTSGSLLTSKITTLKISATPTVATSYERIVVRKTSPALTFDVVNDPCDVTLTGEGVALDLAAGDSVLSDSATTSNLTAAYVSVITGDPEVIVIRRFSGTTKAWDASNNKI